MIKVDNRVNIPDDNVFHVPNPNSKPGPSSIIVEPNKKH
jgi:hypothetical protein